MGKYKPKVESKYKDEDIKALACMVGTRSPIGLNTTLTKQMVSDWAKDPDKKRICIACNIVLQYEDWLCPCCCEYRYINPFIPGWSTLKQIEVLHHV